MGKTCNFELWARAYTDKIEKCGLPVGDGSSVQCAFHKTFYQVGPLTNSSIIADYIWLEDNLRAQHLQRGYLDLTRMQFQGIRFNSTLFISDTKDSPLSTIDIRFNKSEFEDCRFTRLSFQKSVSFIECVFTRTPFVLCSFGLDRGEQSIVDFSECKVLHEGHLFDRCDVSASRFNMSGADLGPSSLSLLLHDIGKDLTHDDCLGLNRVDIATFDKLRMTGDFVYRQSQDQGSVSLEPELRFRSVDFGRMRSAGFTRANLGKASFKDAAIESVVFIDPAWPKSGGRMCVFDDKDSLVDAPGLKQVMALYVSLKKKYESARDFIGAGDWFYREMECRRRLIAVNRVLIVRLMRQNVLSLTPLYRYISSYGENYSRPLILILLLLFSFATVYFYWIGYPTEAGSVRYEFAFEFNDGAVGDFFGAVAFSTGVMLLQSVKLAMDQPSPTPIISVVQVVLTLILVPLFLLALRRKFRR